jgi:hypothetical protein
MAPLNRLLFLAWLRAFLLTQVGGAGLLALAVLTESAASGTPPLRRLVAEVPHTWALLSPALGLVGAALAVYGLRRRGEWLVLATLGAGRTRLLLSVLALALPLGAFAGLVEGLTMPAVAVLRVPGGWLNAGALRLDPGAEAPVATILAAARWAGAWQWPGTALLLAAGAVTGAALGARARESTTLLAACAWLLGDLLRRGSSPTTAAAWFALACLAASGAVAWARRGPEASAR